MTERYQGWELPSPEGNAHSPSTMRDATVAGWTPINQPYESESDNEHSPSKTAPKRVRTTKAPSTKAKRETQAEKNSAVKKTASTAKHSSTKKRPKVGDTVQPACMTTQKELPAVYEADSSGHPYKPGSYSALNKSNEVSSITMNKLKAFRFQGSRQNDLDHILPSAPLTSMDLVKANSFSSHTIYGVTPRSLPLFKTDSRSSVDQSAYIAPDETYNRGPILEEEIPFPSGQQPQLLERGENVPYSLSDSFQASIANSKSFSSSIVPFDLLTDNNDIDDFEMIDDETFSRLVAKMQPNDSDNSSTTVQDQKGERRGATYDGGAYPALKDRQPKAQSGGEPRPVRNGFQVVGLTGGDEFGWFSMQDLDALAAVDFTEETVGSSGKMKDGSSGTRPLPQHTTSKYATRIIDSVYGKIVGRSPLQDSDCLDASISLAESAEMEVQGLARRPHVTPLKRTIALADSIHNDAQKSEESLAKRFKSPLVRKPIVRPPFPKLVRDRSPVLGISAVMNLRTCFRIGEALNSGVMALQNNRNLIIELYARVVSSQRDVDGVKQHFVFSDLFHDRPPFLNGIFELWKGSNLWEYDSGRFLETKNMIKQKLCRCIGRLKKDEKQWLFVVLNIWEASWEDVDHVKGIVSSG